MLGAPSAKSFRAGGPRGSHPDSGSGGRRAPANSSRPPAFGRKVCSRQDPFRGLYAWRWCARLSRRTRI